VKIGGGNEMKGLKFIEKVIASVSILCLVIIPFTVGFAKTEDNSSKETQLQNSIFVDGSQPTDASQNRYNTVTEAIAVAPTVSDENERVTIQIADGIYQEQIIVNKPYITLKSASGDAAKVILTWYYGIGYVYNNIGTNGFYDANVDWSADATWEGLEKHTIGEAITTITYYDKSGVLHTDEAVTGSVLGKPNRWGCGTKLNSEAKYFIADSVTFESSFSYYVTQAEINAGVLPEPQAEPKLDRATLGAGSTVVEQSKYGERAAALHTDSDNTIINNCVIVGKQDTLYIGSNRILFDHCTIQGGTDYIFGAASAVFNECRLVFAGNEDNTNTGVTTAASHKPTTQYGYLFWNCSVDYRLKDKTPAPGAFGRPWSDALGAQVTYYNTTINSVNGVKLIADIGWRDMNVKMTEARFYEYGSVDENKNAVDISNRPKNTRASIGTVLDKWQILEFNPRNYLKGSDNWDPMDFEKNYTSVDNILSTTSIDTSGAGNKILLPSAPAGYEFSWSSESQYIAVSEDHSSINVIRPAYGEPAVDATIMLYAKNSTTGYGDKKAIAFKIQPNATTDNTFGVNGTVTLKAAATSDVGVQIVFKKSGVPIKIQKITIPAGQISQSYKAQYLSVGTYDISITTTNGYKVISGETATVLGVAKETKILDVNVVKLVEVTLETKDFAETWAIPTETVAATGFTMNKYISTGSETANLGSAGNVVYKFTKEDSATIAEHVGGYWDLLAVVQAKGGTIANTDTLEFSYDFLLETIEYLPSNYSYFDLATSTTNAGQSKEDNTRFVRWGVYNGWKQFNMFGAANARVNGDKTQFNTNDSMQNKWYHIVANIDLKNKTVTTTLYNKEVNTILNKKEFVISAAGGTAYPTVADLTKGLYFNVYMNSNATANKMEYYFDNLQLKYNDYNTGVAKVQ
jgi:pectin methylesterase-like acyl-CoA thioesterase